MNLENYLKETTQQALTKAIQLDDGRGVTQGAVSQWLRKGVPAERVLQLVRVSGGVMTATELRPDIYPPDLDQDPGLDRTTADAPKAAGIQNDAMTSAEPSTVDEEAA